MSVTRTLAVILAACLLLFGVAGPTSAGETPLDPPARPNIVMFYIDDTSPHDGSLWNDPTRTPAIYDTFVAHGINFDHAIGEDPLCCPGRANMLTGLHTHNNRVIANQALRFDPSVHIGKSMKAAGYSSMFIGKYLNRNIDLTPEQWAEHDAGWTDLDVIKGVNGSFYNYLLHTKQGEFTVRQLHSTQMVADRTIMHLRETPAATPVFAVLSIYNLHTPHRPLRQYIGDPRCANMPPWKPPNYNEADVSDKPSEVRALPLQPYPDGWPMVTMCEEMLGVDHAIGQVIDELRADGRLDNTLLVFTADNGMTWGQHRLGEAKSSPYATPVPLYMSWPAGWGTVPRTSPEIVSNIDLAPTFCDLAQTCTLGPFARGSNGPDGVSLVPLITGAVPDLGRDAVLEESYVPGDNSWSALRTTAVFDLDDRWHYVEYTNGERELYDLVADPSELENLAADPARVTLIATLHDRLAQLRVEGIAPGAGTIRIVEDALPDSGNDYEFSGDLGNFTLDDDVDAANPNEKVWTDLPSGAYTVMRAAMAPWVSSGIDCNAVGVFYLAGGKLTLYLHPDEEITCTWVDATRQPDASISPTRTGAFKKDNFYTSSPVRAQTVRRSGVIVGRTYDYWVRLQNDSLAPDSMLVRGELVGPAQVHAVYLRDGVDVTAEVTAGTYQPTFNAGGVVTLRVRVTIGAGTPEGSVTRILVYARSTSDPSRVDVVRVVAAR